MGDRGIKLYVTAYFAFPSVTTIPLGTVYSRCRVTFCPGTGTDGSSATAFTVKALVPAPQSFTPEDANTVAKDAKRRDRRLAMTI